MAIRNIMETSLPENWALALYNDKGYDLAGQDIEVILPSLIVGVSEGLKQTKSKEFPVAVVFEETNLEFIAAAIVRFIPSEDASMPGHWNYVWTFDKADVPDNARILRLTDVPIKDTIDTVAHQHKFGYRSPENILHLGIYTMKMISQWLQDNAKEDEENGITLEGLFQARCVVEDHEVFKSFELIGETKAIIKDDAGTEV